MKASFLLLPRLLGLFLLISFVLCAISCRVEDDVATLQFPSTFRVDECTNSYSKVYRYNDDGALGELTREQAGTFGAFLDTMSDYNNINRVSLNFTGLEFLNESQVRIFSDGSIGIPAFDTTVGYVKQGTNIVSLSLDWTLQNAPLIFNLYGSRGNHLVLAPVWFTHTYRPFAPPFKLRYAPLRMIYSNGGPKDDLFEFLRYDPEYGSDFGRGDTVAMHAGGVYFR